MPSLTGLQIEWAASRGDVQLLASHQWSNLHELHMYTMQLEHCCFLQALSQLKTLTCFTTSLKGASAIAQLTGLTQLELYSTLSMFSGAEQLELGSALQALSNLRCLCITHTPPGPVTQALSQLRALTELCITQQGLVPDPAYLTLPSCVSLTFFRRFSSKPFISVRHVASLQAPQLKHLDILLDLEPSDLGTLRELCRGVSGHAALSH
jgi:hypothetical protein